MVRLRSEEASPIQQKETAQAPAGAGVTAASAHVATAGTEKGTRTYTPATNLFDPQPMEAMWSFLALCIAMLVVLLYLSVCFHLTGPTGTFALAAVPVGLFTVGCLPGYRNANTRPRGRITLDPVVQSAFTGVGASRAERLYGEIVLLLLNPAEKTTRRDARVRRDLLKQCNALLRDHQRIETHRKRVQRMLESSEPLTEVEAEYQDLVARMESEEDVIARRSLEESVALCAERSEAVRALRPMQARLDAHGEVIYQALLLARAALTRAQATPVSLTTPDINGLRAAVRRVTTETRAVEEAVTELARF